MSTALAPVQVVDIRRPPANPREAVSTLRDLLEKQKGEIAKVLPKHLNRERLARIAVSAVSRDKKLMECTPISVLRSIMQAAMLGFEPGGPLGDSYLVPYFNTKEGVQECQLIPGYKGLISLSRRSGQILSIEADVVREKDAWSFRKNQDGTLFEHTPSEDEEPGEVLRVYAVARLKDTPLPVIIVMPRREVDAIMRKTQSKGAYGPWKDHYAEMAKKTAIRRIMKYLPTSVEFADALDREDRMDQGEPIDGDIIDLSSDDVRFEQQTPAPQLAEKPKSALDELAKPKRGKASPSAPAPTEAPAAAPSVAAVQMKKAREICGLLGSHAAKCPGGDPPTAEAPQKLMGLKDPPKDGVRIKLPDGSWMDPATGEVDPDEIQGRDPGEEG